MPAPVGTVEKSGEAPPESDAEKPQHQAQAQHEQMQPLHPEQLSQPKPSEQAQQEAQAQQHEQQQRPHKYQLPQCPQRPQPQPAQVQHGSGKTAERNPVAPAAEATLRPPAGAVEEKTAAPRSERIWAPHFYPTQTGSSAAAETDRRHSEEQGDVARALSQQGQQSMADAELDALIGDGVSAEAEAKGKEEGEEGEDAAAEIAEATQALEQAREATRRAKLKQEQLRRALERAAEGFAQAEQVELAALRRMQYLRSKDR